MLTVPSYPPPGFSFGSTVWVRVENVALGLRIGHGDKFDRGIRKPGGRTKL